MVSIAAGSANPDPVADPVADDCNPLPLPDEFVDELKLDPKLVLEELPVVVLPEDCAWIGDPDETNTATAQSVMVSLTNTSSTIRDIPKPV